MYVIYHVKVTFFTLIILLFKLSFTVNFHVINGVGGNFKHFRETKANLRNAALVLQQTHRDALLAAALDHQMSA